MASDTTSGSKSVKISGEEVMLENKSYFKQSTGDEAGCTAKKGVITSVNMGKVYFNAWSMDVKFEGENVVRHFDLTTHNHASVPGNSPPWSYIDEVAQSSDESPCKTDAENAKRETAQDSKPVRVGSRMHRSCSEKCKRPCSVYSSPKARTRSNTFIVP